MNSGMSESMLKSRSPNAVGLPLGKHQIVSLNIAEDGAMSVRCKCARSREETIKHSALQPERPSCLLCEFLNHALPLTEEEATKLKGKEPFSWLDMFGQSFPLSQWCSQSGGSYELTMQRIRDGWPVAAATLASEGSSKEAAIAMFKAINRKPWVSCCAGGIDMPEQDELGNTIVHSTCIDAEEGRAADPCCLPESPTVAANGSPRPRLELASLPKFYTVDELRKAVAAAKKAAKGKSEAVSAESAETGAILPGETR